MSIKVLTVEAAVEAVENLKGTSANVDKSFFDVFATSGCSLNCHLEKCRKGHQKNNLRKEWFSDADIEKSISSGCESCNVLNSIIQESFSRSPHPKASTNRYRITRDFQLQRRVIIKGKTKKHRKKNDRKEDKTEIIQLFQPPGAGVVFHRFYTSTFLGSVELSFTRLKEWIKECSSTHEKCKKHNSLPIDDRGPARLLDLIDIRRNGVQGIKIIDSNPDETYQYACLSHRWDSQLKAISTTTSNLPERKAFIELSILPKNLRDGVEITRTLGIRYLWIDSLCIIQKGDDDIDKQNQMANMGYIYQRAYIVIAAVSSDRSDGGCFIEQNRKQPDICFEVTDVTNKSHLIGARVLDMRGPSRSIIDLEYHFPLLSRGWCFQERVLSKRLLECTYAEFTFECLESSHCECESSIAPHPPPTLPVGRLDPDDRMRLADRTTTIDKQRARDIWRTIVYKYMTLDLSRSFDSLPAIAGFASALEPHIKSPYAAGLWTEMLHVDMLWYMEPESKRSFKGRTVFKWKYRRGLKARLIAKSDSEGTMPPSWSWASIQNGQSLKFTDYLSTDGSTKEFLLRGRIKEVECELMSSANPFGELKGGYMKLEATLYPWYIRRFCRRIRDHEYLQRKRHAPFTIHLEQEHIDPERLSMECSPNIPELKVDGAFLQFYPDTNLMELTFDNFCDDEKRACGLSKIYLLQSLHVKKLGGIKDVFLVLQPISPVQSKAKCYRRIGMMSLEWNESSEKRKEKTWHERVESQLIERHLAPQTEEFWIF